MHFSLRYYNYLNQDPLPCTIHILFNYCCCLSEAPLNSLFFLEKGILSQMLKKTKEHLILLCLFKFTLL